MSIISRLNRLANFFNTLNTRTVEILLQRSPGLKESDTRGIDAVDFQVVAGGSVIQTGASDKDGKIQMLVRGASSTLQILVGGSTVAEYEVSIRTGTVEPLTNLTGRQRRLRILGYHLGHDGPSGNGVGAAFNTETDRSVLEFQGDKDTEMDGILSSTNGTQLTGDAGV